MMSCHFPGKPKQTSDKGYLSHSIPEKFGEKESGGTRMAEFW